MPTVPRGISFRFQADAKAAGLIRMHSKAQKRRK